MNIKVGILCAGDTELEPFLPRIQHCATTQKAMLTYYTGQINGVDIVTLYSGVCKVNAALAAQILIDTFHVNCIISAGTAGGIDASVQLFDTIVGTQVAYHDVDDDILTDFHPWMPSIYFEADARLLQAAREIAAQPEYPLRFGCMVTGEQFIADEARSEILRKYKPLSVDMESAAIAHVCYVNRVPFLAVRTITDTASHAGLEHFEQNCARASKIAADVVAALLECLARSKSTFRTITIRQEAVADFPAVYALIQEAFASAEHADGNEQDLVVALRAGTAFVPQLSLVAEVDGHIVGHILFTEGKVGAQTVLILAPLSISPAFQRQGIGTALLQEGHRIATSLGYEYVLVLGSEQYYPRVGYLPAERLGVVVPEGIPSENFMAICLREHAAPLCGSVTYAEEFGM